MSTEVTQRKRAGSSMSAGALRELVLKAGIEVLDREGLGLRSDSISYTKVFAHLEEKYGVKVTRGSVHERIWDTHDDFRREVLAEALDHFPMNVRFRDVLDSEESFGEFVGTEADPDRRAIEFSRRFGIRLWEETVNSTICAQIQSLKAIASRFNDPIASEVLHDVFARRAESRLVKRRHLWAMVLAGLERQVKKDLGLTPSQGTGLVYLLNRALSAGGYLNYQAGCPGLDSTVKLRSGPSGEFQTYSLASVASRAFLECLTEPADVASLGPIPPVLALDSGPPAVEVPVNRSDGQRRSRKELKKLVLAAGRELLLQDGLALKPDSLRYSTVLAHIHDKYGVTVSRASVHGRLWATHDDYCNEVLARSVQLASVPAPPSEGNGGVAGHLVPPPAEHGSEASAVWSQWTLDLIRVASSDWTDRLADTPAYRRRVLVKASLLERRDIDSIDPLATTIKETQKLGTRRIQEVINARLARTGHLVKPELGLSQEEAVELNATLTIAMVDGVLFDRLSGVDTVTHPYRIRRSDGSGRFDDWTALAIALRAFTEFLYRHQSAV